MLTAISMSAIATNGVVPGMILIFNYITLFYILYIFFSQLILFLSCFSWWFILHDLQSIRPRVWRSSGFVCLPGHHICRFYVHTRNHGNFLGESNLLTNINNFFQTKTVLIQHYRRACVSTELTQVSRFYH